MNTSLHIIGTWFIISTNFPMWLNGKKTNPTFNYTLAQKKGKEVLLDEVKYLKKGKTKTITGYDYPDKNNAQAFTWKGKGLLFIARSHWEIKLLNAEEGWAVIYFSKTLFTPQGVDIISRHPQLSGETLEKIRKTMENDVTLREHLPSIKLLNRTDISLKN